jgi:hypothetical protein
MTNTITRLKWIFIGVFAVAVVVVWTYQILWAWPAKTCAQQARWWDAATRTCATPLYIPALTGRPAGVSREEWSKRQAAAQQLRDRMGDRAVADQAAPEVSVEAKPAEKPVEEPGAKPAEVPARK